MPAHRPEGKTQETIRERDILCVCVCVCMCVRERALLGRKERHLYGACVCVWSGGVCVCVCVSVCMECVGVWRESLCVCVCVCVHVGVCMRAPCASALTQNPCTTQ